MIPFILSIEIRVSQKTKLHTRPIRARGNRLLATRLGLCIPTTNIMILAIYVITPKRTLYNLRKWHYLMTLKEPENEYENEKKETAARLIHASIITPSKCSRRSYNEIRKLIDEFSEHKYNIIPYLRQQRERLHEFCQELLDDMLPKEN